MEQQQNINEFISLTRTSRNRLPQRHQDTKKSFWLIFSSSSLCALVAKIFFHKMQRIHNEDSNILEWKGGRARLALG